MKFLAKLPNYTIQAGLKIPALALACKKERLNPFLAAVETESRVLYQG
ncbi:MAG: hypothetical protein WAT19_14205 [Ferruginibacter sp.]